MTTHEAADLLERFGAALRHAENVPVRFSLTVHSPAVEPEADSRRRARTLIRAMLTLGRVEKSGGNETFWAEVKPAEGFSVTVFANRRAVCRPVIVGIRTIPATEATLVPACPARFDPIVEWQCDESLLAEEAV